MAALSEQVYSLAERRDASFRPANGSARRAGLAPVEALPSLRRIWLEQAARYSVVGVLNTALDATLYLLLTHWLGLAGLKIVAKAISYGISTVNSFHWNRSWTFKSTASVMATFLPFVLASLIAMGVNAGAMYLFLDVLKQYDLPSLLMATGITLLWNFSVSKFIVFKR